MKEILRITKAPVLSFLLIMLGVSFFNTFIALRITLAGGDTFTTGILYASYFAGVMVGALYMERIIRFTGHIRAFAIFAALTAISVLLHTFTFNYFAWFIFRFITGVGCAGLFVVIESWLLLLSSIKTRGVVLSIYMITLYAAQSLGQFIINSFDILSNESFILTALLAMLSIIPVCFMRANAPTLVESEYINIFYLLRKVPLGFLGNLIAGTTLSTFYTFGPVFAAQTHFSTFQISLIMAVTIFGGMALQWPLGILSDLMQRRKVIIVTTFILSLISFLLFFFETMPFGWLLFVLFFFGGFSFTLYPLSITYCCDFFSSAGITAVTCAALIIYGIGCIIGPLVVPLFMHATKPSGLFLFDAICALILTLYALHRQRVLPKQADDTKEAYQAMPPSSSPLLAELDPRSEEEEGE